MGECTTGTVSKTVDPVVAKVHSQEGEPPGPGRVPGQLHQAVVVPHMHVSAQLTASHQQAVERKGQSSVLAQMCLCKYSIQFVITYSCAPRITIVICSPCVLP